MTLFISGDFLALRPRKQAFQIAFFPFWATTPAIFKTLLDVRGVVPHDGGSPLFHCLLRIRNESDDKPH